MPVGDDIVDPPSLVVGHLQGGCQVEALTSGLVHFGRLTNKLGIFALHQPETLTGTVRQGLFRQ